jgi:ATP-dependent DNA ligase
MAKSSPSIRMAVPLFKRFSIEGRTPGYAVVFYAFDLLHLSGEDLIGTPLQERRAKLPMVLNQPGVLMSMELLGTPAQVIAAVQGLGLEGVIAKRRTSRYTPGERHTAWVKLKLDKQQEFVVDGYRPDRTVCMRCWLDSTTGKIFDSQER